MIQCTLCREVVVELWRELVGVATYESGDVDVVGVRVKTVQQAHTRVV